MRDWLATMESHFTRWGGFETARSPRQLSKASLKLKSEAGMKFAVAEGGNLESAAVEFLKDPALLQGELQQSSAERAAEMRATLAPIHTTEGEAAAQSASGGHVHAQRLQCGAARGSQGIRVAVKMRRIAVRAEPPEGRHAIVERNAQRAGNVVVTSARGAQRAGSAGDEGLAGTAGEDAESLESVGDIRAVQAVIAVLALREQFDEAASFEALQVNAGGRGADFREHGQFGAGAGAPIEKAIKHAGAGGFANGGGDGRSSEVGIFADIHSLMINESLLRSNEHSAAMHPGNKPAPLMSRREAVEGMAARWAALAFCRGTAKAAADWKNS